MTLGRHHTIKFPLEIVPELFYYSGLNWMRTVVLDLDLELDFTVGFMFGLEEK